MNMKHSGILASLFLSAMVSTAVAEDPKFDTGMIPATHILLPQVPLTANVVLISDAAGWGSAEDAQAKALLDKGAAVIGIDLPTYISALEKDEDDCVYMISDVEALSQQIQRSAGNSAYHLPIVAGIGDGGALALAMAAQSPNATIAETIAVDPVASISLKKVLCTPATKTPVGDRTIYGLTDGPLPDPITILLTGKATKEGRDQVAALQKDHSDIDASDVTDDAATTLQQTLSDRLDALQTSAQPLGLPLDILEAPPTEDTMAIIFSGDGGWRDLDSEIGGYLQSKGVPVVGVDSLRYFWSEKKPSDIAHDLSHIINVYRQKWNVKHVVLVGYSFGADVLPATYNLLPKADKARVQQISLLALSQQVDYQISVMGWLGASGDGKNGSPVDDIKKIDPKIVQCVYGTDDDEDPCPTLKSMGVEANSMEGGHHFDENYDTLSEIILKGLKSRVDG